MNNKKRMIFAIVLFIASIIFIALGINKKEFDKYYRKSVYICTQCIGIG